MNACQLWRVVGNCTMWECPNRPWTCCIFFVQNTLWCTANECLDFWFGFYIYLFLYPSSCSWFHLKYISLSNKCKKIKIYCDENLAWCIFLSDNPAKNPNLRSVIRNAHNFARKNLFFITTVVEKLCFYYRLTTLDAQIQKRQNKWTNDAIQKQWELLLGRRTVIVNVTHTFIQCASFSYVIVACRLLLTSQLLWSVQKTFFFLFFFVIYVTLFICLMNESARELNSVIISDEWIIILLHAIRVCINNCRLVLIDFFFCCCDDWLCLMTTYHHITHHSLMIRIRNFMSNSNRVTFQLEFIWITNSAWEFSSILSFVIDVVWWFSVGSLWERQQSVCEWILFILPTK